MSDIIAWYHTCNLDWTTLEKLKYFDGWTTQAVRPDVRLFHRFSWYSQQYSNVWCDKAAIIIKLVIHFKTARTVCHRQMHVYNLLVLCPGVSERRKEFLKARRLKVKARRNRKSALEEEVEAEAAVLGSPAAEPVFGEQAQQPLKVDWSCLISLSFIPPIKKSCPGFLCCKGVLLITWHIVASTWAMLVFLKLINGFRTEPRVTS